MTQETPPTEQELRDHFGDSLPADTAVERIPHTTVWATEEGVLLWDGRNGYADLAPPIKVLMYVTGAQGSGKSTLVSLISGAVEVDRERYINSVDLIRNLDILFHFRGHSNVIVANQRYGPSIGQALKEYAKDCTNMVFASVEI